MSYLLPLSCHYCRGELRHVNGTARSDATEQVAVAKCGTCARSWMVLVQLRPLLDARSERRATQRATREPVAQIGAVR